jgi:ribosomal protein L4
MTLKEAKEIVYQVQQQFAASGREHDLILQAIVLLTTKAEQHEACQKEAGQNACCDEEAN